MNNEVVDNFEKRDKISYTLAYRNFYFIVVFFFIFFFKANSKT